MQAVSSGAVDVVQDFTGWMWGKWFSQREMARLSLGPFLAEVCTVGVSIAVLAVVIRQFGKESE